MQYIKNKLSTSKEEFFLDLKKEERILDCLLESQKFQKEAYDDYILENEFGKIKLVYKNLAPFCFEIRDKLLKHQQFFYKNSPYKDPLARALGLKKGKAKPIVFDATAGALNDSMLIYSYGVKKLYLYERHPIVAMLIYNALRSVTELAGYENIEFVHADVGHADQTLPVFDVGYFDPMYEEKNLKTAPKKEMLVFRNLIKGDTDRVFVANRLFEACQQRLVIKRSNKASPLLPDPDITIKAKSTSYDVYLKSTR